MAVIRYVVDAHAHAHRAGACGSQRGALGCLLLYLLYVASHANDAISSNEQTHRELGQGLMTTSVCPKAPCLRVVENKPYATANSDLSRTTDTDTAREQRRLEEEYGVSHELYDEIHTSPTIHSGAEEPLM